MSIKEIESEIKSVDARLKTANSWEVAALMDCKAAYVKRLADEKAKHPKK